MPADTSERPPAEFTLRRILRHLPTPSPIFPWENAIVRDPTRGAPPSRRLAPGGCVWDGLGPGGCVWDGLAAGFTKPSPSWPRVSSRTSVRSRKPALQPGSAIHQQAPGLQPRWLERHPAGWRPAA
jgi:hypothetical protein